MIYLDHNATTPVFPDVARALTPFLNERYGNPSSLHGLGSEALREIRRARNEIADLLGAREETEIVFTSGGTESNNTIFRSVLWTQKGKRRIVTTAVEHSSILKLGRALQEEGIEVVYCPVDGKGHLDRNRLREALTPETALLSVMMANNETGVIFPVEEIGREAQSRDILFHVDAVQAVGKLPLALKESPIHFLSLSGHKLGAPKGIGALYVKRGTPFRPLLYGGSQERGRRAGTENVPGIVGLGAAARHLRERGTAEIQRIGTLRDDFEEKVPQRISSVEVNGDPENRLPNTSNLFFDGIDSEALLILLDEEGVCASSGSACLSGSPEPSHVLKAMGFSEERAKSSIRFSFGAENTREEVDTVVDWLARLVARLREIEFKEQHPHSVVH